MNLHYKGIGTAPKEECRKMPLLLVPVAYRVDSASQYQEEIDAWGLKEPDVASVQCPCEGCTVQYGILFPFGLSLEEKVAYIDCLIGELKLACPEHPGRICMGRTSVSA